ncbi:AI-2E family transporter [Rhizobium rhizogenes]|uniref:AI-2E family transporter n=1 Tax=Rhizobium rhizogenes TaxID=359 RepID=UPI001574BFF0|nr:AI-2E family transporter [Rhizobium rhizogenes]NTF82938.1 AI-2E family transporter [Rhizobium rhizogenes]
MFIQRLSFYLLLVLVTIAFFAIILPFYSAIFWAVVFAIIFFPVHRRLESRLPRHRNVAAALSTLMCVCLVIVPGLIVLSSLVQEGNHLYQRISNGEIDLRQVFERLQGALPLFLRESIKSLDLGGLQDRISSVLVQSGGFFAGRALSFGQNTVQVIITLSLMLYLLFFMFRDGRFLAKTVQRAIPMSDAHVRRFVLRFTSVVRATVKGNVIIAALQGSIGGAAFWALGIEPALLWGVLMSFLSLLPAIGAALIWVPAAIYLALIGEWLKAFILVATGILVIGLVDNFLRPPLVGQETKLPDYVVLVSTIGGISLIGLNGFVIGPLVAALFIAAWEIFIAEQDV